MRRLSNLLADGGILVLETPDCSGITNIETRYDYAQIHPLEHINAFTPITLKHFATSLGFAHIAKPVSVVTCDLKKITKGFVKHLLNPLLKPTTQMYFRKI
jgi:hypothetical protein